MSKKIKKVLFLQNKGNSLGGVWFVNKIIGEELVKNNFDVEILNIRNEENAKPLTHDPKLKVNTINKKDRWEITHRRDVLNSFQRLNFILGIKTFFVYLKDYIKLKKDFVNTKKYIQKIDPDYIVTTQYQLLDAIPKKYYNKTINEHHNSFENALSNRSNIKKLKKYNDKIRFLWLCKNSLEAAKKYGFNNNYYIYNPIKFSTNKIADVTENKKLITISRLSSSQKRIDLMIAAVNKFLKKHPEWTLELYGDGQLDNKSLEIIKNNSKIKLMGRTDNVKETLLNSSIYLSTSAYEGFSLSILEANECGIPCIAYDYGESCSEQIINGETGYIVPFNKEQKFLNCIEMLVEKKELLKSMSKNSKEFAKQFSAKKVTKEWIKLFEIIDGDNND
ncbi:MAG: glycosyltransferase family 4 protein [Firmicutes bacterium]|nr:glycosyltransferase family 4 protein [Bacillota bacterium]